MTDYSSRKCRIYGKYCEKWSEVAGCGFYHCPYNDKTKEEPKKEPKEEKVELKSCPFCGGEAELYVTKHIPHGYDYTPRCKNTNCCGRLSKKYGFKSIAINKWNLRAGDPDGS